MTLLEIVVDIHRMNEEHTIYAAQPWTHESRAVVALEPDEGGIPDQAALWNMQYFLEVSIAQAVLDDWLANLSSAPTPTAMCDRLIEYATSDA